MATLRFPNAASDIGKFIETFQTVYKNLNNESSFSHDKARDILIKNGLVSSSGAIGQKAIERSTRKDRTKDPLYNQLKMYSEVYRMLGWYKPAHNKTNFKFTELSEYMAEVTDEERKRRLFEECLLGITFPNYLVENRSRTKIRPFAFILKLANKLGNVIFRDEIILGVLNLGDDTESLILDKQVNYINTIRGDLVNLENAINKLGIVEDTQVNTLQNYTRFPLGSLKYTNWATDGHNKRIYGKSVKCYSLTEYGIERANQLNQLIDIRNEEIQEFSLEERGAFSLLTFYSMLERAGYPMTDVVNILEQAEKHCEPILKKFKIENRSQILYSPIQQGKPEEIQKANELSEKFE